MRSIIHDGLTRILWSKPLGLAEEKILKKAKLSFSFAIAWTQKIISIVFQKKAETTAENVQ